MQAMHPAYFATHFRTEAELKFFPQEFAIITAYATTGERWTDEENRAADDALRAELVLLNVWHERLEGYSPETSHAEPGWAAQIRFVEACAIGARFRQDAIYYVRDGVLHVSYCDERQALVAVAQFSERFPGE